MTAQGIEAAIEAAKVVLDECEFATFTLTRERESLLRTHANAAALLAAVQESLDDNSRFKAVAERTQESITRTLVQLNERLAACVEGEV